MPVGLVTSDAAARELFHDSAEQLSPGRGHNTKRGALAQRSCGVSRLMGVAAAAKWLLVVDAMAGLLDTPVGFEWACFKALNLERWTAGSRFFLCDVSGENSQSGGSAYCTDHAHAVAPGVHILTLRFTWPCWLRTCLFIPI